MQKYGTCNRRWEQQPVRGRTARPEAPSHELVRFWEYSRRHGVFELTVENAYLFESPGVCTHWCTHNFNKTATSVRINWKFKLSRFELTRFHCKTSSLLPFEIDDSLQSMMINGVGESRIILALLSLMSFRADYHFFCHGELFLVCCSPGACL